MERENNKIHIESRENPEKVIEHLKEIINKKLESRKSIYDFDNYVQQYKNLGLDMFLPDNINDLRKKTLEKHSRILHKNLEAVYNSESENEAARSSKYMLEEQIEGIDEQLCGNKTKKMKEKI